MNLKTTSSIFALLFILFTVFFKAQDRFSDFKKEKTYIQTNHVFYKPGEEMYFKILTINAENNLPTQQSKVVHFELVDPGGSVIKKDKLEIVNGYSTGSFYFSTEMKGGIYKLRAYTQWMLNETGKNVFEKEITLQKIVSPRILMKLDFPKKGYGAGDEVTAEFSMRSLSNAPIPFYEANFTVMREGEIINGGQLLTDKEGKHLLKFNLPPVLSSTDALLTIKISFDGFIESISRNIPIVLNNLDLKFMPEGGIFINELENNIAYKVLDEFDKPVDAVLEIFNNKNEKLLQSEAYHFGMGAFKIRPKAGETYYAKVLKPENISSIYQLPVAVNDGIVFNIIKLKDEILFQIGSQEIRNITIKGSFRGKEVYSRIITIQNGKNEVILHEKDLPVGICRFTIYENELPLAERILFANEHKQLNIKIKPNKKYYLPREKVVLNIETSDENNKAIPSNLGISVIDDKLWTYADEKQNNITSWLLMDSELRGKIERPPFYFDKKEEKAHKSLDLVMLTNGYRYFELLPEVIKDKKYKYPPEKKNTVYGIVEDENKNPVKAEIYLVTEKLVLKQTTAKNGLFYFTDLDKQNSNKLVAKSLKSKQKVKIRMIAYNLDVNPIENKKLNNADAEEVINETVLKEKGKDKPVEYRSVLKNNNRIPADTLKTNNIESVVITGYNTVSKKTSTVSASTLEVRPNANILNIAQGQLAGVEIVSGNGIAGAKPALVIRGTGTILGKTSPLVIVDGVPVHDMEFQNLNMNNIAEVIVLKDAVAKSEYGSGAINGVLIINTKTNRNANIKIDITPKSYFDVFSISGYALNSYPQSRTFAYPEYKSTNTVYRYDYREAIYWNPIVETNGEGKAQVEFYNSDANTTFRVLSEGISAKGQIGRNETTYAVQSLISIDAKIPQYLTRTDELVIPVIIKNNSAETKTLSMDVVIPKNVKLIKADSTITLKPLESGRLFVQLQTDKIIDATIQFSVKSGEFRETMILPFKVEEKGFPHKFAIINNKSENLEINIPDVIAGSLLSSYIIFENSSVQMFEDLERFKREPYGCFEQLSSTVYPNVFILDYLKKVKKINQDTESTVVRNMKKGYQKMLSYKQKDGGFAYFNAAQSDVSVSAFALLEFTDLKKYIKVEPKILQELTTFIVSKKKTNGFFEVRNSYEKNEGFSEYYYARNMYVLYALSKIGYKAEIETGYDTALKRVLENKDSYQLALMANTADHLGKVNDRNKTVAKTSY